MTGLHAFRVDYPTCAPIWIYSIDPEVGRKSAETLSEALHKVNSWEPRIWKADDMSTQPVFEFPEGWSPGAEKRPTKGSSMNTQPNLEPTVLDQIGDASGSVVEVLRGCRGWRGKTFTTAELIDWLGVDPDMPVARLREDLAIATRARQTPLFGDAGPGVAALYTDGWNTCLEEILGGSGVVR